MRTTKNGLIVKDAEKIKNIWEVFAWLDECRWATKPDYPLIDYAYDDLSCAEKILTHWLCYITDRQMRVRQIWEKGGYVISAIARSYTRNKDISPKKILEEYVKRERKSYGEGETETSLRIEMRSKGSQLLERVYGIRKDEWISFSSRYMATDLACILRTLVILQDFENSISRYVTFVIDHLGKDLDNIAFALFGLTYLGIGRVRSEDYKSKMKTVAEHSEDWRKSLQKDPSGTIKACAKKFDRFQAKRLWCALRDYIKYPEFSECFAGALNSELAEWWKSNYEGPKSQLHKMEIPGDVWNNSEYLRVCLLGNYIQVPDKNWKSPMIIRELYKETYGNHNANFYPEQFDVTFDFVPRMCANRMCRICFFGPSGIQQLCNPKEGNYCSVALATCGITISCVENKCKIHNNLTKYRNLCTAPLAFGFK